MDTLTALSMFKGAGSTFGEAADIWGLAGRLDDNADLKDIGAQGVLQAGEEQAKIVEVRGDKIVARQRAMYAKAGVNFTGSPALVWAESEKNLRMDVISVRLEAAAKASAIGFQALQERIAAGRARTAAIATAGKGILDIAGGFAVDKYAGTSVLKKGGGKPASPRNIEDYVSGG